jgi:hypothetical protein
MKKQDGTFLFSHPMELFIRYAASQRFIIYKIGSVPNYLISDVGRTLHYVNLINIFFNDSHV